MKQLYNSADTSINTVCKIYRQADFQAGTNVLDFGGGKYNSNTEYMKEKMVSVSVYDPYNRTAEHNEKVLSEARTNKPDYVVCSNVLNVILEDEIIDGILQELASFGAPAVYIAVYEGDRTGKGKATSKGFQRNEKTSVYLPKISRYFEIVSTKKGIITCTPKQAN